MKLMKLNIQLFGHTNSTENYDLPQFVGTDKPTWLGDFNTAMSTIDTAVGTNASAITSLGTRVTSAEGIASQASTDVAGLTSTVNTLSGNVQSVTTTANNAQSTATSALNTANTANGKADTNATNIGDLTDLETTVKTDLVSAVNTLVDVVLFDNPAGVSAGDTPDGLTLNDSISNYKYIEIFYKNTDDYFTSVKVYQPNGKEVILQMCEPNNNNTPIIWTTMVIIANNKITMDIGRRLLNGTTTNGDWMRITHIVGYK